MDLFSNPLIFILLASGLAYAGSRLLMKGDERIEQRRGEAVELAGWARENGLPTVAAAAGKYAVGDYSGLISDIRQAVDGIRNGTAEDILDRFLKAQLARKLADPEQCAKLLDEIERVKGVKIPRPAITQAGNRVDLAPAQPKEKTDGQTTSA